MLVKSSCCKHKSFKPCAEGRKWVFSYQYHVIKLPILLLQRLETKLVGFLKISKSWFLLFPSLMLQFCLLMVARCFVGGSFCRYPCCFLTFQCIVALLLTSLVLIIAFENVRAHFTRARITWILMNTSWCTLKFACAVVSYFVLWVSSQKLFFFFLPLSLTLLQYVCCNTSYCIAALKIPYVSFDQYRGLLLYFAGLEE